jgi:hypothetical protein
VQCAERPTRARAAPRGSSRGKRASGPDLRCRVDSALPIACYEQSRPRPKPSHSSQSDRRDGHLRRRFTDTPHASSASLPRSLAVGQGCASRSGGAGRQPTCEHADIRNAGRRAQRWFRVDSFSVIRAARISLVGACREWPSLKPADSRRAGERVRERARLPGVRTTTAGGRRHRCAKAALLSGLFPLLKVKTRSCWRLTRRTAVVREPIGRPSIAACRQARSPLGIANSVTPSASRPTRPAW